MIKKFLSNWLGSKPEPGFVDDSKAGEARAVDPLDPIARQRNTPWPENEVPKTTADLNLRKVSDFPIFDGLAGEPMAVGDAALAIKGKAVMDDSAGEPSMALKGGSMGFLGTNDALASWYMSQGFIGYQMCALMAQHWLVDKACSMSGEDAVRNGWFLSTNDGDDLDKASHDLILKADKKFKIREQIVEFNRFKNVFGIRVAIFKVESDDELYYEKPFNIDGVRKGAYKGISQVDPYWMTPILQSNGANDPSSMGFYEPQYWQINGKKYHISHLCIARGPQPADILKPTYIFGGISLVQRIFERVYAAERTANEAPLMAMSKRTMAIHADLDKVMANQCEFEERLALWIRYRDNHGVKVLGTEESMEQFDTAMSDFDSIIMNQYQIVAAIARVPSTKLLGTSPKGFNATGEFESKSYHEELESVQEHVLMPMLERHYELLSRSLGINAEINIVCNPVDSVNTQERAELNKTKADLGIELINAGVISPDEERARLIDDEHSGYDRLRDDIQAEEDPGASPENLANMEKAGAATTAAQNPAPGSTLPGDPNGAPDTVGAGGGSTTPGTLEALIPVILQGLVSGKSKSDPMMGLVALLMAKQLGGGQPAANDSPSVSPSISPSTIRSINSQDAEIVRQMAAHKMPKMRLNGLNIHIENPKGTVRTGTDMDGTEWASEMPDHYGYIKGYMGADGQDVDCFLGPDIRSDQVYVIAQRCPHTGEFDEYKCMIGYNSPEEAHDTYHQSYGDDWDGFDHMLPAMTFDEFKEWLEAGGGEQAPTAMMSMQDEDFKESEHPRAPNGKFGQGSGGGAAKKPAVQMKAKTTTPAAAKKPAVARSLGISSLVVAPTDRSKWPDHIKKLAVPPAWHSVKIAKDPNAALLAYGRDEKDRPQYRYSDAFKKTKAAEKFERVKAMNAAMGGIKSKVGTDQKSKDAKTKNNADSLALVIGMGLRPGSDTDTKAEKKAHGASNLEARHIIIENGKMRLDFVGKKGVDLSLPVNDAGLVAMLKERKAKAGGPNGRVFPGVTDKTLLQYSHTLGDGSFKTKDFRTYKGTSKAIAEMKTIEAPTNAKEYKERVKEVATRVSQILGNTPTVALQSYIEPSVFSEWKANIS